MLWPILRTIISWKSVIVRYKDGLLHVNFNHQMDVDLRRERLAAITKFPFCVWRGPSRSICLWEFLFTIVIQNVINGAKVVQ